MATAEVKTKRTVKKCDFLIEKLCNVTLTPPGTDADVNVAWVKVSDEAFENADAAMKHVNSIAFKLDDCEWRIAKVCRQGFCKIETVEKAVLTEN